MKEHIYNVAFIDGQNLHMWIQSAWWNIDLKRFRIYLKDKFHVQEAYYFLWCISEGEQGLYDSLQNAWFIVSFREHSSNLKGKKKWNVDVDIVFESMKKIIEKERFDQMVLVSGDGDYIRLVKYLIKKGLLRKVIFPNKQYSSLYNDVRLLYGMTLSVPDIRKNLQYKKKEVS